MNKAYNRIIWQNQPSTATALGATNLNKLDIAMNTIDDRVVAMDTAKANQSIVNELVKSITYNESNGVITITKQNGTSTTIDTKLEKLAVNFTYNPTTQKLIITLDDKTTQEVDLSSLISQYEFLNSDTVAFTLVDGKVKANVVNGSITANHLQPNYLADITVQAQTATGQANKSKRYAVGGVETGDATDNAKYYKEQAELFKNQAKTYRDEAEDISGVGVAAKDKLGLVNGNGNVEVRTAGDMWADPFMDKVSNLNDTFITCPTADDALVEFTKITGSTIQTVSVGSKNIFNGKFELGNISSADGSDIMTTIAVRSVDFTLVIPFTSYVLSGEVINIGVRFFDSDKRFISSLNAQTNVSFVTPDTCNYIKLVILNHNNLNTKIQLEQGTVASTYVDFSPSMPSPAYPSTLEYDKNTDVVTTGTNILDISAVNHYPDRKGITSVLNSDGTVTVNGTSTESYTVIFDKMLNLPYGIYRVDGSGMVNGVKSVYAQISLIRKAGTTSYITDGSFIVNDTVASIRFAIQVNNVIGTIFNNVSLSPRLTVGMDKVDYEQYKGDKKTINFPLMGVPLAKNSVELINGKKFAIVKTREVVFDGTESFGNALTSTSGKWRWELPVRDVVSPANDVIGRVVCSHFKNATATDTWYNKEGISVNATGNYIHMYCEAFSRWTIPQFQSWVREQYDKGTPLTVQYQLHYPLYTNFDIPVYLKSWKGTTNAFALSNKVSVGANFKSELFARDFLQDKGLLDSPSYNDKGTGLYGDVITTSLADDGLAHVKVITGKTEQKVTLQGKNICDNGTNYSNWGSKYTKIQNGFILEVLTNTELDRIAKNLLVAKKMIIGQQYTLSFNVKFLNNPNNVNVNAYLTSPDAYSPSGIKTDGKFKWTFIYGGQPTLGIYFQVTSPEVRAEITNIQVENGDTVTDPEPFTPNSPSPEYPSPLSYAKDFNIITYGKNMFDPKLKVPSAITGTTLISNEYKNISFSATVGSDRYIQYTNLIFLKKGQKISISRKYEIISGSSGRTSATGLFRLFKNHSDTGAYLQMDVPSYQESRNFTVQDTGYWTITLYASGNASLSQPLSIKFYDIQIELGDVSTTYELPQTDSKSISFPFMGLQNSDPSAFQYVDGAFTSRMRVKEVKLNGGVSEVWSLADSLPNTVRFGLKLDDALKVTVTTTRMVMCDKLQSLSQNELANDIEGISPHSSLGLQIRINKNRLVTPDAAGLRAWLAQNPLTVQYRLSTSVINEIDPIYLKTFKGLTTLASTSTPQVAMTADFKSEFWTDISKARKLFYSFKEVDSTFSYKTPIATVIAKMPKDSVLMVNIDNVDDTEYIDSGDLVIRKTSSSFAVATHTSWERNIWTSVWTGTWSGWSGFPLDTQNFALFMGTSSDTVNLPNKFPTSQVTFGLNQKINSVDSKVNTIIWNQETLTPVAPNVSSVMNGSVQYYKSNGVVCISVYDGQLKSPMTVGQLITLFTLPAGLRPVLQMRFPLTWTDNKYAIMLIVDADGVVKLYSRHNATIPALTPDFMGSASFSVRTMD